MRPEDQERQFILKYSLADGKISIHELSATNSGIQGGKFLSSQLIPKNDCFSSEPDYYTCKDLYIGENVFNRWILFLFKINQQFLTISILCIGAMLYINCRRFIITSADLNDYRYMQENPELFSKEAIESVRNYLISTNCLSPNEDIDWFSRF